MAERRAEGDEGGNEALEGARGGEPIREDKIGKVV